MEQGKTNEAMIDFNKAIAINSKYAPAYNNRGIIKHKNKKYKDAIKDFSKAISLDKNFADAFANRGVSKEMNRDMEGACKDWSKANELGSQNGTIYHSGNCSF